MDYQSLQEITCKDAARRLMDARRSGEKQKISAAEANFQFIMEIIREDAPQVWKKYKIYFSDQNN
jgi:hypothetical protein